MPCLGGADVSTGSVAGTDSGRWCRKATPASVSVSQPTAPALSSSALSHPSACLDRPDSGQALAPVRADGAADVVGRGSHLRPSPGTLFETRAAGDAERRIRDKRLD